MKIKTKYKIRLIKDIYDHDLSYHWKRIEEETDCFPQMYYEWCTIWWRLQSGKRTLHIVTVEDDNKKIVGIAPLCIEKRMGLRVLRSFPIHFGDFYSFIVEKKCLDTFSRQLIWYIQKYKDWDAVRIEQVCNEDPFYTVLKTAGFQEKNITDIVIVNFKAENWHDYLRSLDLKFRSNVKRYMKIVEKEAGMQTMCIERWEDFEKYAVAIDRMHSKRWEKGDSQARVGFSEEGFRQEGLKYIFNRGKGRLFLLLINKEPVGFVICIYHRNTYYHWQTSFEVDFGKGTGVATNAYLIKHIIENKVGHLNFMAGLYDWKLRWSPEGTMQKNFMLFAARRGLRGFLLKRYYMKWRDEIKKTYEFVRSKKWKLKKR